MSIALALAAQICSTLDRRAKERQLLFVGAQFREALGRYYDGSPGPQKQFPATLEDLLHDKRYADTRRYLRKIYLDPLTGQTQWGLVKGPDGTITGVYSLAAGVPIKVANFEYGFAFSNKKSYAEWIFGPNALALLAVTTSSGPVDGSALPSGAGAFAVNVASPGENQSPSVISPTPQTTSKLPNQCNIQARNDAATCAAVATLKGAGAGTSCTSSAQLRLAQCLAGTGLGPLYDLDYADR